MKQLSVTLKVRLISDFFQTIIAIAFLPYIALYLTDMVNQAFSGIFLTTLIAVNLPISLISGYIMNYFSKKTLVLIYQFILAISLVIMSLCSSNDTWHIVIFCMAYALFSIVWGLQFPTMDALIMDAITPEVEHYIYKIGYWLSNVATAIGALIGGITYGYNRGLLFLIAAIVFLAVFLALYRWLPNEQQMYLKDKKVQPDQSSAFQLKEILATYRVVLNDKLYMLLIIGHGIFIMAEFSTSSYIAIRLKQEFTTVTIGIIDITGVKMYSLIMLTNTVVVVLMTYIVSKVVMSLDLKQVFAIGITLYTIGYVSITFLNQFTLLIIFVVIATIGEIIYSPIVEEQRFKMIPKQRRGPYVAMNTLSINLAELLARLGIILGVLLTSVQMGIYMLFMLGIGSIMMYQSIRLKLKY